jgi:hypothetical protein
MMWNKTRCYVTGTQQSFIVLNTTHCYVTGTQQSFIVLNTTHCYVTGTSECNGNHLSYTSTGPAASQGEPKCKFQDKKPGNYFD